jgi:hypothetical protein
MRSRGNATSNRDETINAAVRDGKIRAADADQYRQMWDANPEPIRNLLTASVGAGGLMPGLIPASERQAATAGEYNEDWLSATERDRLAHVRTASVPAAASAPASAAAGGGDVPEEYVDAYLTPAERGRIAAIKAGEMPDGRVMFEDDAARRAANAGSVGP